MPTLNRFPLLGLWAEEAARRIGYARDEAESLGHAYAVLYAIRAQRHVRKAEPKTPETAPRSRRRAARHLSFGGDELEVTSTPDGKVRGKVGGDRPQTPQTYAASVRKKFPPGYYERLQASFRQLLKRIAPRRLDSRLIYNLYDEWKRTCGVGRRVDLDKLLVWCEKAAESESAV
jgi:hypothetical protein